MRGGDFAWILALPLLGGCQVPVVSAVDPLVSYAIQSDQDDLADRAQELGTMINRQIRETPAFANLYSATTIDRDLTRNTRPVCYVIVSGSVADKTDLVRFKDMAATTLNEECRVVVNSTLVATPDRKRYRSQ
jgi:hypothetical protein